MKFKFELNAFQRRVKSADCRLPDHSDWPVELRHAKRVDESEISAKIKRREGRRWRRRIASVCVGQALHKWKCLQKCAYAQPDTHTHTRIHSTCTLARAFCALFAFETRILHISPWCWSTVWHLMSSPPAKGWCIFCSICFRWISCFVIVFLFSLARIISLIFSPNLVLTKITTTTIIGVLRKFSGSRWRHCTL